ncbi:MAG: methyltransferase [Wenzhouxiangella sp.]|nr:methyltransferase [Wenzhouxiangella sp.]
MKPWKAWIAPLLRRRDRLLADRDFQRWSLRLPVARWIARRRMRALFDLCSGFVYSQVLLACTRLGLLELLSQRPHSAAELVECLALPRASVDRLLEAAESLELIERRDIQQFGLGPLGAALLGNPAVSLMIEHHSALYADLSDPVALLRKEHRTTDLGRFWAYSRTSDPAGLGPEDIAAYSDLMAASQVMIADQVLMAYPLQGSLRLLDVGGGAGAFAAAAMGRNPELQARVFDLPSVCERARQRFEDLDLGARAGACGGNFLTDPLPRGDDVISLIRVLHDHDDDAVMQLLGAVRRAIAPGGVLLIAEPMLGTPGAEPVTAAYFGFYLMAMGQGRARTADEIRSMLHEVGFGQVREHRTSAPLLVRTLTARPRRSAKG